MDTIEKELFKYSKPNNYLYVAELHNKELKNQFDHLACFIGGTLAQGAFIGKKDENNPNYEKHFHFAQELTKSCAAMYFGNPTGLAPEIVFWNDAETSENDYDIHPMDKFSILRPETVESIFYLWRVTHGML